MNAEIWRRIFVAKHINPQIIIIKIVAFHFFPIQFGQHVLHARENEKYEEWVGKRTTPIDKNTFKPPRRRLERK